eukprot:scaffold8179_cov430-Prasinococcus_capsulatus_cf.AAC.9
MTLAAMSQLRSLSAVKLAAANRQRRSARALRPSNRTPSALKVANRRATLVASVSSEEPKVDQQSTEVAEPKESFMEAMAFRGTAPELINGR